jgi:hypothetical protein
MELAACTNIVTTLMLPLQFTYHQLCIATNPSATRKQRGRQPPGQQHAGKDAAIKTDQTEGGEESEC